MEQEYLIRVEKSVKGLPKITQPPHIPATEEEKVRRRALGQEADRLAKLVGPIGISSSDLIRQIRDEAEGLDEEEADD